MISRSISVADRMTARPRDRPQRVRQGLPASAITAAMIVGARPLWLPARFGESNLVLE
jgi:hypothetical protein